MDNATFLPSNRISATLSLSTPSMSTKLTVESFNEINGVVKPTQTVQTYSGDYEVTVSLTDDIILDTDGKILNDDIRINKIGFSEVSNDSGGYTICIGGY